MQKIDSFHWDVLNRPVSLRTPKDDTILKIATKVSDVFFYIGFGLWIATLIFPLSSPLSAAFTIGYFAFYGGSYAALGVYTFYNASLKPYNKVVEEIVGGEVNFAALEKTRKTVQRHTDIPAKFGIYDIEDGSDITLSVIAVPYRDKNTKRKKIALIPLINKENRTIAEDTRYTFLSQITKTDAATLHSRFKTFFKRKPALQTLEKSVPPVTLTTHPQIDDPSRWDKFEGFATRNLSEDNIFLKPIHKIGHHLRRKCRRGYAACHHLEFTPLIKKIKKVSLFFFIAVGILWFSTLLPIGPSAIKQITEGYLGGIVAYNATNIVYKYYNSPYKGYIKLIKDIVGGEANFAKLKTTQKAISDFSDVPTHLKEPRMYTMIKNNEILVKFIAIPDEMGKIHLLPILDKNDSIRENPLFYSEITEAQALRFKEIFANYSHPVQASS